jgi:hypothetical protein
LGRTPRCCSSAVQCCSGVGLTLRLQPTEQQVQGVLQGSLCRRSGRRRSRHGDGVAGRWAEASASFGDLLGCWLGAGARGGTGPKVRADKPIPANRLAGIRYTIPGSPDPNATLPRPEPTWLPSPRTTPSAKQLWSKPPKRSAKSETRPSARPTRAACR